MRTQPPSCRDGRRTQSHSTPCGTRAGVCVCACVSMCVYVCACTHMYACASCGSASLWLEAKLQQQFASNWAEGRFDFSWGAGISLLRSEGCLRLLSLLRYTWQIGSPDVVPMFAKAVPHVETHCFPDAWINFSGDPRGVDTWVLDTTQRLVAAARHNASRYSLLMESKCVARLLQGKHPTPWNKLSTSGPTSHCCGENRSAWFLMCMACLEPVCFLPIHVTDSNGCGARRCSFHPSCF